MSKTRIDNLNCVLVCSDFGEQPRSFYAIEKVKKETEEVVLRPVQYIRYESLPVEIRQVVRSFLHPNLPNNIEDC
jgi:hypothetical protein